MNRTGEALWNAPISQGNSALRNAGATLVGHQQQQQQRTPSPTQQQTQQQYTQPSEYYKNEPIEYVNTDDDSQIDHDIYSKAINVSSPRLSGIEGEEHPGMIRKKVIRRVEVPFTRQVKVPTQTTQIVPTYIQQRVPVKKLIAVPGYKLVDEQYTEYEEREAIREKEIWVKKIVPEKYVERVPVTRVRQVQKPTTVVKEVESYETVQVPSTKKVLVDGYRVDEVQDSKVVEVEEYQDYELKPSPIGAPQINSTRDLGRLPNSRLSRSLGHQVFPQNHPSIKHVDMDTDMENEGSSGLVPMNTATHSMRGTINGVNNNNASAPLPTNATQINVTNNNYYHNNNNGTHRGNPNNTNNSSSSYYRPSSPTSQNLNIHGTGSLSSYSQEYGRYEGRDATPVLNDPRYMPAAGAYRKPATSSKQEGEDISSSSSVLSSSTHSNEQSSLGMTLDDTHTRHTDGTGVLVSKVVRGALAARSGLQPHDIITSVNGIPSTTVDEFNSLLSRISGPLNVTINRDGRRNVALTLYR